MIHQKSNFRVELRLIDVRGTNIICGNFVCYDNECNCCLYKCGVLKYGPMLLTKD